MKIILIQDGPFWFVQGVDLDYGIQGDTPEEARENFVHCIQVNQRYRAEHGLPPVPPPPPSIIQALLADGGQEETI